MVAALNAVHRQSLIHAPPLAVIGKTAARQPRPAATIDAMIKVRPPFLCTDCRWRPRLRLRGLAIGLLTLLPVTVTAAGPAAPAPPAIYVDPPQPKTRLPAAKLLPPQAGSPAAATFPALQQAFASGRLDVARQLAQAAVDATVNAGGERDPRTLDARLNRAVVSLEGGDARVAGEQFTALIDEASAVGGLRAPQLEPAWYGLGLSLLGAGNPGDAERAFAAALQQKRISDGLHTPEQAGYLDAMTLTARSRGRLELADSFQLRRIELAERLYDDASIERADAARVLADWYGSTGRYREALQVHAYRIDILGRAYGRDDPRLVPALLDEARSYAQVVDKFRERPIAIQTRNGTIIHSSEQPLNQALRLMKQHDVKLSAPEHARMLIQIGDVHWLQSDRKRALIAWQRARGVDATTAQRLAQPEPLEWPNDWPAQAGIDAGGQLELRFSVSERGRVGRIELVGMTPAADANGQALFAELRKLLSRAGFRPAVGSDRVESRDNLRYRHLFQPSS